MKNEQGNTRSGLTLIEVMVGLTVLVVGVLGAMMFRYYSALDARKADIQVGAGRVALLILEGWKGAAGKEIGVGSAYYSPAEDIPLSGTGESDRIYISGANPYTVQLTGGVDTSYSATLTRLPLTPGSPAVDITGDGNPDPGLAKLTVQVTSTQRPVTVTLSDYVRTN